MRVPKAMPNTALDDYGWPRHERVKARHDAKSFSDRRAPQRADRNTAMARRKSAAGMVIANECRS